MRPGTSPISSSHSRAAAASADLARIDAPGRQLPQLAIDARAILPDRGSRGRHRRTGISTTDGRCRTIATSCSRAVGKATRLDLDGEDAAFVDDDHVIRR